MSADAARRELRVRVNAGLRLSGLALDRVLRGVLLTPILIRSLGLDAYGQYAAVVALVALARPLVLGAAPVLAGAIVRAPDDEARLVRGAEAEALLIGGALWAALTAGAALLGGRGAAVVAALLGVQLVGDAAGLRNLPLQARSRDSAQVGARAASSVALLAAALLALRLGGGVRAVAACLALSAVLEAAMVRRLAPPLAGAALGRFWRLPLLRASAAAVAIALLDGAGGNLEIVLLARLGDTASAGALGAMTRLYGVTWLVPYAISAALLPLFAAGGDGARARCERTIAFLLVVGVPLAALAPAYLPLAPALLGERIAPALAVGPLLAWRIVCAFLHAPVAVYLVAVGKPAHALRAAIAGALVLAVGCAATIPRYGIAGAAASALAGEAVKLAVYLAALGRASARRVALAAVAPLAASALALGLARALGAGALATSAAAAAVYALALTLARAARRAPLTAGGRA